MPDRESVNRTQEDRKDRRANNSIKYYINRSCGDEECGCWNADSQEVELDVVRKRRPLVLAFSHR
jgi:hypothetical protein